MKRHGMIGSMIAAAAFTALMATASAAGEGIFHTIDRSSLTAEEKQVLIGQVEAARQAGVPSEDLEITVTRSLERSVSAAMLGRFIDTSARVARQGLPVRPVLDRVEQGLSKGVPPERIDAAGRRLAEGLAKAKPLVDSLLQNGLPPGASGAKDAALESVARAGEQSLSAEMMQGLGEKVRTQGQSLDQFERAVRALSFLTGNGMPADAAGRVVQTGIERGLTERDFGRLERKLSDMVRQGRSMDEIVRAVDRQVREGRGPGGENREGGKQDRGAGGGRDAGGRTGRGR